MSNIEWTDETWNPVVGCSRVSEGCRHCYAERQSFRNAAMGWERYRGLTKKVGGEIRWTGVVRLVPQVLQKPLRWKKPRRIFVNSMSDLFHESLRFEDIAKVMERMCWGFRLSCRKGKSCECACEHDPEYTPDEPDCRCWSEVAEHTYQILTKRPKRMLEFFAWVNAPAARSDYSNGEMHALTLAEHGLPRRVWLGVSVEDQATADERIPLLLQTPAAVRFVSYEPALAAVGFTRLRLTDSIVLDALRGGGAIPPLSWLIIGGESGPGARPFDLAWARSTVAQCKAAGVPVFYKQGGSSNRCAHSSKGGCFECFPDDLKVREFPSAA